MTSPDVQLLGAAAIRELADRLGVRPTKQWGQNFVCLLYTSDAADE